MGSSCWPASWAAASAPTSPDAASSPSTAAPTPSGAAALASGPASARPSCPSTTFAPLRSPSSSRKRPPCDQVGDVEKGDQELLRSLHYEDPQVQRNYAVTAEAEKADALYTLT